MIVKQPTKRDIFKFELQAWNNARSRCVNPNVKAYWTQGALGIKMCPRWLDSFDNFLNDMGERPAGGILRRRNLDDDYSPSNCFWDIGKPRKPRTSTKTQGRPSEIILSHNGQTHSLMEWSKLNDIQYCTMAYRQRIGWSDEQVLGFEPPPRQRRKIHRPRRQPIIITANGKSQTVSQWAKETGKNLNTIYRHLKHNWDHNDIINGKRK